MECLKTLPLIMEMGGGGGQNKLFIPPLQIFLKVMEQCSKTLPLIIEDYTCLLFIYRYFYLNFFQNEVQLLIIFHEISTAFL